MERYSWAAVVGRALHAPTRHTIVAHVRADEVAARDCNRGAELRAGSWLPRNNRQGARTLGFLYVWAKSGRYKKKWIHMPPRHK